VLVVGHQRHQQRIGHRHHRASPEGDKRDRRGDHGTAGGEDRDQVAGAVADQRDRDDADAAEPVGQLPRASGTNQDHQRDAADDQRRRS